MVNFQQPFTLTPRVIAHLGEDLIKNESIALIELVKNSYDANAVHCSVNFNFDNNDTLDTIVISDDGMGMSMDTIKNVWLVIGTSNKKEIINNHSYSKRPPLGEKGIGRLGVHKLGRKITLFTKEENGSEIRLYIDWDRLNDSKAIDDFVIDIEQNPKCEYFAEKGHGTIIQIESLKGSWDRRKLRSIYRDLTSLNSPFVHKDDSFVVQISANNDIFRGLPNIEDILNVGMYRAHCSIEDNQISHFVYRFCPWDSLTRIHGREVISLPNEEKFLMRKTEDFSENGSRVTREQSLDLRSYAIGKIDVDLVVFERDISVFSYVNTEKKSLNEYLRENGGIRVYRDDIRVYNYGEKDNDWLGLDSKRLGRAGGSIGNSQVIGSVSISRVNSSDLKEKTNREGFIENEAYFAFADAVKYAIDCIVRQRNIDKFNLLSIYKSTAKVSEPVVGELNELIDVVEKSNAEQAEKSKIKNYLIRIGQQYKNVRDTLIRSANVGLNLGVAVHEMEKNVSRLKGLAERGEIDKIKELADRLEKIVAGYSVFLANSEVEESQLSSIVRIVIENNMFRFKDHNIKVFSNYKNYNSLAKLSKAESIASLTNLIDNSIYWVSKSRIDDRMLYIYLTDEIKGYASIVVCDNGPGFKLPPEMAIQPFVTGKPMNTGMGLGLHITNEVMNAMKGKLLIMDPYDLQLPKKINQFTNNPTTVALCFPLA